MNTSTITVADSNAFMADLRGAAYAAKHDPKILAELKELSRQLRSLRIEVMQFYKGYFIEGSALPCTSV
jgi:hypothetical protein